MNKKQLLEREIVKNFLNEASVFSPSENQGPATAELKKSGINALKGQGIPALQNYMKALEYNSLYQDKNIEEGLRSLKVFVDKLNDALDPNNIKRMKSQSKEGQPIDIAIEAINKALLETIFSSGEYELNKITDAPIAGVFSTNRN